MKVYYNKFYYSMPLPLRWDAVLCALGIICWEQIIFENISLQCRADMKLHGCDAACDDGPHWCDDAHSDVKLKGQRMQILYDADVYVFVGHTTWTS